ncbi:MAG: hypothetical protein AB7Q42_07745 [Acidimicrobiia bacterium]
MTKNLTAYVSDLLPDHDVLEMRVAHRGLSHRTVVARFDDVEEASRAAASMLAEAREEDVELVAIVPPDADPAVGRGVSVTSESTAGVSPGRVTTWGIAAGLLGGLVGLFVGLAMDEGVIVGVLSAAAGFSIGAIVGSTIGGLGRFGGERAWQDVPSSSIHDAVGGVLAVHAADEDRARNITRKVSSCVGAMDVRVLDEDGFWHTPAVDD